MCNPPQGLRLHMDAFGQHQRCSEGQITSVWILAAAAAAAVAQGMTAAFAPQGLTAEQQLMVLRGELHAMRQQMDTLQAAEG